MDEFLKRDVRHELGGETVADRGQLSDHFTQFLVGSDTKNRRQVIQVRIRAVEPRLHATFRERVASFLNQFCDPVKGRQGLRPIMPRFFRHHAVELRFRHSQSMRQDASGNTYHSQNLMNAFVNFLGGYLPVLSGNKYIEQCFHVLRLSLVLTIVNTIFMTALLVSERFCR